MSTSIIPVKSLPDQRFTIELDGQDCEIHIYLRYRYLYLDLYVNETPIVQGAICLNNTEIIQFKNRNFNGNLMFIDTQGLDDPYYTELNERWFLVYVQ